jgi:hypothetical protein
MPNVNQVFAIYSTSRDAELAVDDLVGEGFEPGAITALFGDNKQSTDFARRKHTRGPAGTEWGPAASAPLHGTWGLREPATGPIQGALEGALAGMGVPDEWGSSKLVEGKVLLSVECRSPEDMFRAEDTFRKAAEETDSSEEDGMPSHG